MFAKTYGPEAAIAIQDDESERYWLSSIDERSEVAFLSGHLKLGKFIGIKSSRPVVRFSIVRDPYDRFVSLWSYAQNLVFHELHKYAHKDCLDFFNALREHRPDYLQNEQCLYLSRSGSENSSIVLEEIKQDFNYVFPIQMLGVLISKLQLTPDEECRSNSSPKIPVTHEHLAREIIYDCFKHDHLLYSSILTSPIDLPP